MSRVTKRFSVVDGCLTAFLAHFFFHFFLQLQVLLFYRPPDATDFVKQLALVVGGQFENLLVSLLLAALFLWLQTRGRWVFMALFSLLAFYLVGNQVFLKIFAEHFQFGFLEGQVTNPLLFLDSIWGELDFSFWVNFALVLAGLPLLYRHLVRCTEESLPRWIPRATRHRVIAVAMSVLFLALSYYDGMFLLRSSLTLHPVVTLAKSAVTSAHRSAWGMVADVNLHAFRQGSSTSEPPLEKSVPFESRPDVVLFVLESVGSLQILEPHGMPDGARAPYLAEIAKHSIVFSDIYGTFPATVRSHVPLNTGGYTLTWGSVFQELKLPWRGPTLVGAFAGASYRTALFSAAYLDFENLAGFYRNLPFATFFAPDLMRSELRRKFQVNSWGIDEREVARNLLEWAKGVREPFFVQFLTSSTHHPYSVPEGWNAEFPGNDRMERYKSSIHFSDSIIRDIVEGIRGMNRGRPLVVAVVGDHGQAFGTLHPGNLAHKNFLYEENVKNFLILADMRGETASRVVRKVGSLGDVAPTLLDFAGITSAAKFKGRNLLLPAYEEGIVYFHKSSPPEKCGLRDGRWKFIMAINGDAADELYDLEVDPMESKNEAGAWHERLAEYRKLCLAWYGNTNHEFRAFLR